MGDAPPVAFVHGLASTFEHSFGRTGWADLITDAGRPVIGLDLPGHGSAPPPAIAGGYDELESVVEQALDEHREVDAVGHSLGARVLMVLAARRPERFRRLVLLGIGENAFRRERHDALIAAFRDGPADEDVIGQLFVRAAQAAGNDPTEQVRVLEREAPPLAPEMLAAVRCPVLVVSGEQDFVGSPDVIARAFPQGRAETVPRADHFGVLRDVRCIDMVLDFLDAQPS